MRRLLAVCLCLANAAAAIPPGIVGGGGAVVVAPPGAFPWTPAFRVLRSGYSAWTDLNFAAKANAVTKTYYVNCATGVDAAAGTAEAPLLKVQTALGKADVDEVRIAPGLCDQAVSWNTSVARSVNVRRWGTSGEVILSRHWKLTYAADGTYTNTFSATTTAADLAMVRDAGSVAADGRYYLLTRAVDAATCDSTEGTWYLDDAGDKLYVHLVGGRTPAASDVRPYSVSYPTQVNAAVTVYVEDITFDGGDGFVFWANGASSVYLNRCRFRYGKQDAMSVGTATLAYAKDSIAEFNGGDGFRWNGAGGPQGALINCIGRYNGLAPCNACNGYSRHLTGGTLVVGGSYHDNAGPNIRDIGTSKTWIVGARAWNALTNAANFHIGLTTDVSTMWLDHCVSSGSTYDLGSDASATLYTRAVKETGAHTGAGAFTPY